MLPCRLQVNDQFMIETQVFDQHQNEIFIEQKRSNSAGEH